MAATRHAGRRRPTALRVNHTTKTRQAASRAIQTIAAAPADPNVRGKKNAAAIEV